LASETLIHKEGQQLGLCIRVKVGPALGSDSCRGDLTFTDIRFIHTKTQLANSSQGYIYLYMPW